MSRAKLLTMLVLGAAVWPTGAQAIPDPGLEDAAADQAPPAQDLRSPDARDAAGVGAEARAQRQADAQRRLAQSRPVQATATDGFEWGDAGIGAGVILGLGALAGGTVVLIARGRQRAPSA
jgi:hypothetical protein